ncbi:hypothetical protein HanOQP8_Chr05g0200361 [Helianthus annuus]|nr:hypothetical protein HanOQP8_Chr05g0200361 [Helianthus annuus]
MDLLCNAYSNTSDEDEDVEKRALPPLKRAKHEFLHTSSRTLPVVGLNQSKNIPTEAPIAGRYISKRERTLMASASQSSHVGPPTYSACSPGSFFYFFCIGVAVCCKPRHVRLN